jgi:hypothetical protein
MPSRRSDLRPLALRVLALLLLALWPAPAAAFCGFYVSGSGGPLVNDATQVVLMRQGLRTVLSMQNDYQGPPEGFALVIPVPIVLQKENVRTLPRSVFEHVDRLAAPRLVEYWEQDPCPPEGVSSDDKEGGTGARAKGEEGSMGHGGRTPLVTVEAEFSVDEYDIVILSALDAVALDTWLRDGGYRIPAGADRFLRPYVQAGSKFFVARVDPRKVAFTWGRATLAPLRFFYDTESFALPVRLGLMNAEGPQDLVVHILAPSQRYEVANYENLFIPTNLEVADATRAQFPSFYASLFDRAVAGHPRAVVTEYAWSASSCDPCPTPPLADEDLFVLGADVLPPSALRAPFALTRLHARYTRDTAGEDLVFRPAPPIEGGREGREGLKSAGAHPSSGDNNFQARYVIRHRWEGAVDCADPRMGVWGGPPGGEARGPAAAARGPVARRDLSLDQLLVEDQPALGVRAAAPRSAPPSPAWRTASRLASAALRSPWLVVAALIAGAILVVVGARGAGGKAARSLLALVLLATLPALQVASHAGWQMAREAGSFAMPVAATFVLGLARILAGRLRGGADRAALLVALAPTAVGILRTGTAFARALEASREPGVDADLVPRILAEGQSEALAVLLLGLGMSAILCLVVAWHRADQGAVSLVLLIPVAPAVGWIVAVAVPTLVGVRPGVGDVPVFLVIAVSTVLAARFAEAERDGAPDAALRACVALGVAAGLAGLGALLHEHRAALGAVAGESVDPSQKLLVILRMIHLERLRAGLLVLDVLLAAGPIAWAARHRGVLRADGAAWRPLVPGLVVLALLGLAGVGQRLSLDAHLGLAPSRGERFASTAALTLPAVGWSAYVSSGQAAPPDVRFGGPALWVTREGALLASAAVADPPRPYEPALWSALAATSRDLDAAPAPLLAAHAGLRFDGLLRALSPLLDRRQTRFLLLGDAARVDARGAAAYAGIFGAHHLLRFDVDLVPALSISPPVKGARPGYHPRVLALLLAGGRARAVVLQGRSGRYDLPAVAAPGEVPLGLTEDDDRARAQALGHVGRVDEIVVGCPAATEAGALAEAMLAITGTLRELASSRRYGEPQPSPTFVLTSDTASLEQALSAR